MYAIILCISYLVLGLLMILVNKSKKKQEIKMTRNNFVVKFPTTVALISLICSFFFLVVLVLLSTVFYDETATLVTWILLYIFFISFILLCFVCFYASIRVKLIIKDNNITYYPPFSPKKEYTFDDITSVKHDNLQGLMCYKGDKKIFAVFTMGVIGYELFESRVHKHLYEKKKKNSITK